MNKYEQNSLSEEDTEVFKVKKSTQSKRLSKRREKERRKPPDGESNKYDNHNDDVTLVSYS